MLSQRNLVHSALLAAVAASCARPGKVRRDKVTEHAVRECDLPPRRMGERNKPCPCGSGIKFKKCCRVLLERN